MEILFRGKPKTKLDYCSFKEFWKDNCKNGFVYGNLVKGKDKCYICVSAFKPKSNCYINNSSVSMIEVIPETVGMYIGKTDENNVEIFTGDIVRTIYNGVENVFVVIFDKDELDFKATNKGKEKYGSGEFQYLMCCEEVEIIGHIHDNPELLRRNNNGIF